MRESPRITNDTSHISMIQMNWFLLIRNRLIGFYVVVVFAKNMFSLSSISEKTFHRTISFLEQQNKRQKLCLCNSNSNLMQDKLMEINNTDKAESVSIFLSRAYFIFPRESNFIRQERFNLASHSEPAGRDRRVRSWMSEFVY